MDGDLFTGGDLETFLRAYLSHGLKAGFRGCSPGARQAEGPRGKKKDLTKDLCPI